MGLLDDAIREHLDLKRRHGAAEDEIARQEQEALGPPRRGDVPEPLRPVDPSQDAEAEPDVLEPPLAAEPAGGAYAAPAAPTEDDGELAVPAVPEPREEEDWLEAPPEPGPAAVAAGDVEPEEDVLEETPEFLQETPEHDRLWFEQKPPKDFDFDK